MAACCVVVLAVMVPMRADAGPLDVGKAHIRGVSAAEFQDHIRSLQELVAACGATPASCDAAKVGDDDRVDALHFQMRWRWLRDAVRTAHDAKPAERAALLQGASDRLDEIAKENAVPTNTAQSAQFLKARTDADRILESAEFNNVQQVSWWDRQKAKFWLWVERGLMGAGGLGAMWPWLGTVLEVLLFGGAAVGLLLFVRRSLQRQRLAVALNAQSEGLAWKRDSTDWAMQAEASARSGDWRDAVHCLYWATIVMLEGRRTWRHNPSRTPREYVRLLKADSAQQGALRGLTQIFERLWYGLRDASPADYERARALYEGLRDNQSASVTTAGAA